MFKTRKSILAVMLALFVVASFGIASADQQVDGMMTNNGVALPLDVPAFAGGLSANLDNFVNPGGLGDALLYNYYNARSGMNTFFTVVNTSTAGQRVRVRFREAADIAVNGTCSPEEPRGSFEVLDFDICLSQKDMWSGYITAGSNGGAMLCSGDTDTFVYDGNDGAHVFPAGCVPFKFGSDNGQAAGNISADNTMEGYFEIIGERELIPEPLSCWPPVDAAGTAHANTPDLIGTDVPNVLFGNAALINGQTGATYTYDATAIADFTNTDITQPPTTSLPTLASGAGDSLLGVNYILMKEHLYSVYDLANAGTEFIITEPTKSLTQVCGALNDIFDDDRAQFTIWNDKEESRTTVCAFSPCPAGTDNHLPFEVNIIALNDTKSVNSTVSQTITTGFTFGWFDINLNGATTALNPLHQISVTDQTGPTTTTTRGWPVLGLTLLDVSNGFATGTFKMQYSTNITNNFNLTDGQ